MDKKGGNEGGKSVTDTGPRTKIRTDFAPDHSGYKKATSENRKGTMGGSTTNLSHSLGGGVSAKMR